MRRRSKWAGDAAAVWAFLFATLSLYWAAGGTAGLRTVSREIRERAVAREPGFVAILWVTVALKVVAGLLALALGRRWGRASLRRLVVIAGWSTGVLLVLYGGVGLVAAVMAELGVTESTDPATTRWYLFLWEPVWLVGGVLFILAAHSGRRLQSGPAKR